MDRERLIAYYRERATLALALAENVDDPRDAAAFKSAARAWETLARDPVQWSYEGDRLRLAVLKTLMEQQQQQQAQQQQAQPVAQSHLAREQRQIGATPRMPVATITF